MLILKSWIIKNNNITTFISNNTLYANRQFAVSSDWLNVNKGIKFLFKLLVNYYVNNHSHDQLFDNDWLICMSYLN